ncbi:MAG: 30S ribosomal protein S17 [Candidatus Nanoarchaeia archaeon]|nr:30S ribosomal protein S17 [Candidatus Nanoarchaeia archaeon]
MTKQKQIDIGLNIEAPKEVCVDKHCPFHGGYKVHGRTLEGDVTRDVTNKTANIEFTRILPLTKFERFEKRISRIKAHVPPCILVKKGNLVKIAEGRKISKTKNFVVVEVKK